MRKRKRRLQLNRETLRILQGAHLRRVRGGETTMCNNTAFWDSCGCGYSDDPDHCDASIDDCNLDTVRYFGSGCAEICA